MEIINDNNFEEKVLNSKGKVLVDFYADWCGPCQMLGPVVERVSEELKDCTFYKLNVDQSPETSEKYSVMSIPTLMVFKDGEVLKVDVGMKSKEELLEFINN